MALALSMARSGFLSGGLKRMMFWSNRPDRESLQKLVKLSPEASWLVGSLLVSFGALAAASDTARTAFLGGFPALESVLIWFLVWSCVGGLAFLGFGLLSGTRGKSLANWVLTFLLFVGLYLLLSISGISSSSNLFVYLEILRIPWASPVFGLLASLFGAAAMFVGFHLYRILQKNVLAFEPFSIAVAVFILGGYFGILSFFLPEGVNYSFTSDAWPLLWGTAFLLFSGVGISRQSLLSPRARRTGGFSWPVQSILLALIPLIPIFRYLFTNLDFFSISALVLLFAVTAGLSLVAVVFIPVAMALVVDQKTHSLTASAGLYVLYNMASLSGSRAWYREGNLVEQIAVLVLVFLVLATFSRLKNRVFASIVVGFIALEIALSLVSATSGAEETAEVTNLTSEFIWVEAVTDNPWVATPDVYLLGFESYANEETLNAYGIDNSEQIEFLMDSGFTIYDGTYTVSSSTKGSLSRTLEVSSNLTSHSGEITAGKSVVNEIFQSLGYETHGIFPSDNMFRQADSTYSSAFPPRQPFSQTAGPLTSAVLLGEFLFEGSFVTVDYQEYLEEKRRVLGLDSSDPTFLVTHNSYPGHSQNSGACRPKEFEDYANRLGKANREMTMDIRAITDFDDAIVIIAGDHGPYLTKNCYRLTDYPSEEISRLDVQDRFGAFLAIRWPREISSNSRIEIVQDIFPAVFSALIGSESLFEEARIVGSTLGDYAGPVRVEGGVIRGGQHDGEPLFLVPSRPGAD